MPKEEKQEDTSQEAEEEVDSFTPEGLYKKGQLFRPIDEIRRTAKPLEPLWGSFLFKKALTLVVGDPGVGKTTMGYDLTKSLCLGMPFLNIRAEEKVSVLYMDFESADSLVSSRGNMILGSMTVPNFYIYNIADFYLNDVAQYAIEFSKEHKVNLIFVDNQTMAFPTRDENDNAEAAKQMRYIRSFANACDVALVLFHHPSKANLAGTRKGTGAFARARLADICMNINLVSDKDKSLICIETVKNRLIDDNIEWYIKKEAGSFIFVEAPLGQSETVMPNTAIYQAQQGVLAVLPSNGATGGPMKRQDIIEKLPNVPERLVIDALARLVRLNKVESPKYSYYQRKG